MRIAIRKTVVYPGESNSRTILKILTETFRKEFQRQSKQTHDRIDSVLRFQKYLPFRAQRFFSSHALQKHQALQTLRRVLQPKSESLYACSMVWISESRFTCSSSTEISAFS